MTKYCYKCNKQTEFYRGTIIEHMYCEECHYVEDYKPSSWVNPKEPLP